MTENLLETCRKCNGEGHCAESIYRVDAGYGYYNTYVCDRCFGRGEVKWTTNILKPEMIRENLEVVHRFVGKLKI